MIKAGSNALIGMLLVLFACVACSTLRPKQPLTWHVILEMDSNLPDKEAATRQAIELIEKRLDLVGISNFEVKSQGSGQIIVNLPEVPDRVRLRNVISTWGKLELFALISPLSPAPVQTYSTESEAIASLKSGGTVPSNRRVLFYPQIEDGRPAEKKWVVAESPAILDGSELRSAVAMPDPSGDDNYQVNFSLKKSGAQKFGAWTGTHINSYLAVVFNGSVVSIAHIKSQIFDSGQINGRFSKGHAEDVALVLNSGAFPAPVRFVAEGDN